MENKLPENANTIEDRGYPVSAQYRKLMLASLEEYDLQPCNGVICWVEPIYGELVPADPAWFAACGIDLGLRVNPKKIEEASVSNRLAWLRLQRQILQHAENLKIVDHNRGKFVFALPQGASGTNVSDIDYATLCRLAVLSTHLQYHGRQHKADGSSAFRDECYIMCADCNGRTRATKRDIRRILNLPLATWESFWNICTTHGYITGNDEDGYQLVDVLRYGQLDRKKSHTIQKIYAHALHQLYDNGRIVGSGRDRTIKRSDHRLIGMLMHLAINHMCARTNEIVANPKEPDLHKQHALSDTDIARALGYDTASGHAARDVGKLRNLTFCPYNDGPEMYCIIRAEAGRVCNNACYIINPALIYAGRTEDYSSIMANPLWYVKRKTDDLQANGCSEYQTPCSSEESCDSP